MCGITEEIYYPTDARAGRLKFVRDRVDQNMLTSRVLLERQRRSEVWPLPIDDDGPMTIQKMEITPLVCREFDVSVIYSV